MPWNELQDPKYDQTYNQLAVSLSQYAPQYPELAQWLDLFRRDPQAAFADAGSTILKHNTQLGTAIWQQWQQVSSNPQYQQTVGPQWNAFFGQFQPPATATPPATPPATTPPLGTIDPNAPEH